MIEETAVVVKCEGEFAWVEAQRKSACGHCSVNKSCGTGTIAKIWGQKSSQMKAINKVHACEGDTVLVGLQEAALVQGSLIIYLLPIVSMILFAIFGKHMAGQWQLASVDGTSVLFAVIGFLLAGILIKIYSKRISADARYQPVVLKRLSIH
ncbi:MAG: SoxR reducing system RseC family protein [Gammaproteobacteria bacterium]|nr:SoxR reducing system RseC family protein [Gammaproteobacteria bacterium]